MTIEANLNFVLTTQYLDLFEQWVESNALKDSLLLDRVCNPEDWSFSIRIWVWEMAPAWPLLIFHHAEFRMALEEFIICVGNVNLISAQKLRGST